MANFCAQCGARVAPGDKFCPQCGQTLTGVAAPAGAPSTSSGDWRREMHYDLLIQYPTVKDAIARHAARAKSGISAEAFMSIADKLSGAVIPTATIAEIAQPLWASLGVKTGKNRRETLALPIGEAMVRTLCGFAENSLTVTAVNQAQDGCALSAKIPADIRSGAGELHICLTSAGEQTLADAAAIVPGQLYDWGKSQKILNNLFAVLARPLD